MGRYPPGRSRHLPEPLYISISTGYPNPLPSGPDIFPSHCIFKHNRNGEVFIEPVESAQVFLNGEVVEGRSQQLKSCDRIALGRFHLFRFEAKGESRGVGM
jgi:FHA domain